MRTTTTTPSWFPPQSRHRPYDRRMLRLRMAPNYGTEGFRDAVRGGQEYIKSRGGGGGGGGVGRGSGGGGRNDDRDPEQRRTRQRRQQLQQQEQQQQQQQQQQQPQPVDAAAAAPRKIPFPKLTPGRERNYRPPHVVSAMLQRQELMRFDEDEDDYGTKDYCDGTSSNEEHCLENFRDGRESARYLSVGGPAGGGGGGFAATTGRAPPAPLPRLSDARANFDDNHYEDDEYDNEDDFDDEYDDKCDDDDGLVGGGGGSEVFREGLKSSARGGRRSGSDVEAAGDNARVGGGSPGGGGGIARLPPSPPTSSSSSSSSSYSSSSSSAVGGGDDDGNVVDGGGEDDPRFTKTTTLVTVGRTGRKSPSSDDTAGGSSMSFRDGKTRMAVYKDGAFRVRPVGDTHVDATVEEEEEAVVAEEEEEVAEEEEEGWKEEFGNAARQAIDDLYQQHSRPAPSSLSATTFSLSSSSKKLLSIDPKSIDIVPLSKGKKEEMGEENEKTTEDDHDDVDNHGLSDSPSSAILDATAAASIASSLGGSGTFVKMFRGSASYIANHRGTIAVYHIPGELLAWEGFPGLMDDIALTWLLGMKIVLVAGCRHQIDLRLDSKHEEEEYDGDDEGGEGRGDDGDTDDEEGSVEQQLEQSFGGKVSTLVL